MSTAMSVHNQSKTNLKYANTDKSVHSMSSSRSASSAANNANNANSQLTADEARQTDAESFGLLVV